MGSASKRKSNRNMMDSQVSHNQKLGSSVCSKRGNDGQERTLSKGKKYVLVSFRDLPDHMKDNEFILGYYRANWPLKEALFSIFRWHNETLNVWTHFVGFLLFLGLAIANLMQVPQASDIFGLFSRSILTNTEMNSSNHSKSLLWISSKLPDLKHITPQKMDLSLPGMPTTRWPFYVFLGGSMFCLLSSSICHLFSCHSHKLNILFLRIDYTGITIMIITSFFPPIYYIFQCDSHWQFIYIGGITAMGVFTIVTLLSPSLSSGKYRAFRALLFCSMGFFGLVPAIHAVIVNWSNPKRDTILAYESAMALFYLTGTGFYISRIPERLKPGWFDLAGHSHQIFHVFVVLGALAHYGATLVFLDYRDRVGCEVNP
ncbi:hypothetical protein K2173_021235 [Erythroxylum novogranatense]|uniref:Heptahelical transmembrane protein 1-like n=1 Tax=Erythroxylum novogranatense TaxID=1862640 RepID=A0AAV8TMY1_9ROSI|nr:hypothetical protein K2173_021235 [Erythroxylum novogranatense]